MTVFNRYFVKKIFFVCLSLATFSTLVNASESKNSVLNKYESNGFECLNISDTVNEDTLKSYTDLNSLENTDRVHVCVRIDMTQNLIAGNKYVFVFDQEGVMKTHNQIASILD